MPALKPGNASQWTCGAGRSSARSSRRRSLRRKLASGELYNRHMNAVLPGVTLDFSLARNTSPASDEVRAGILADPGFGRFHTDHMVSIDYVTGRGWHNAEVLPYGPIELDPSAIVLHYAQEIFEGLKAYRWADGSIVSFRPEANAARLTVSAERLAIPPLPETVFLESLRELIAVDADWVPAAGGE